MNTDSLVIVGGGPSGIACAIECINQGMDAEQIQIFEKGSESIHAIRKFYPDKKMTLANYKNLPTETLGSLTSFPDMTKTETIDYFDRLIREFNLNYRLNSEVHKVEKKNDKFNIFVNSEVFCSKVVAIAIGILGRPNKPGVRIPLSIKRRVVFDLTSQPIENAKVLVVGGGDTSAEYCQILIQQGCDVTFIYRKPEITKMMNQNLESLRRMNEEGLIRVRLGCELTNLEEGLENKAKVTCSDGEYDEFDFIVYAIGGMTPVAFLKSCGIEFTAQGWPEMTESGETNISNLFLLGDLVAGKTGGSIITSFNSAYLAAREIIRKLQN